MGFQIEPLSPFFDWHPVRCPFLHQIGRQNTLGVKRGVGNEIQSVRYGSEAAWQACTPLCFLGSDRLERIFQQNLRKGLDKVQNGSLLYLPTGPKNRE